MVKNTYQNLYNDALKIIDDSVNELDKNRIAIRLVNVACATFLSYYEDHNYNDSYTFARLDMCDEYLKIKDGA